MTQCRRLGAEPSSSCVLSQIADRTSNVHLIVLPLVYLLGLTQDVLAVKVGRSSALCRFCQKQLVYHTHQSHSPFPIPVIVDTIKVDLLAIRVAVDEDTTPTR